MTLHVGAADTNQIHESTVEVHEEQVARDEEDLRDHIIDTVQERASTRLVSLAHRLDSFFGDPEYTEEEADARASLQQKVRFYRNADPEFRTRVRASIVLPNLCRRLRLSFEGNDELYMEEFINSIVEDLVESTEESIETPSLRLQYLFIQRPDIDLDMSGGVRLSESAFYTGPRLKLRGNIGAGWNTKFTQRVYWYSTDNVISKSQLRFDHILGRRNLFRQAFRTTWNEEKHSEQGFCHSVTSSIIQPLKENAAFRYTWSSTYRTRPDNDWQSTTLSVGFRQNVWRRWIFFEAAPFVTWEKQYDWDPSPGIVISFSTVFEKTEN